MSVDPATTHAVHRHDGAIVSFCSAGCAATFIAHPEHYTSTAGAPHRQSQT